ncbi:hypothetical protein FC18_GL002364 [Lacticaseibacillus sharpeae JCM 1186 = DSM 20505]|uniref:HTH cro/C1-type domain-containing protein n=2 Tax=Lacticaseibacillus sharpeae TaxID=1626 RepID=A0A0R1ZIH8_9LACO|nr:hypothetical protein FC18_GL002364 [Lacticaseibacillus sharpeae JCM 1186 = DSM 20505]
MKEFRETRGITLEAASFGTSVSVLSRFERGESNLSNTALNAVMTNIGVAPSDLRIDSLMFHSPFIKALGRIKALRVGLPVAKARVAAADYRRDTADHAYFMRDLNVAVFDWMIDSFAANEELRMPATLQRQIAHVLIDGHVWGMYDFNLYSFVMDFLDTDLIVAAYKSMRNHEHFQAGTRYADDIAFVLWHVGVALTMRGADDMLPVVEGDLLRFRDAMTDRQGPLLSNLVLAVVRQKLAPGAASDARLQLALKAPQIIGMDHLAEYCQLLVAKAHGAKTGVII